MSTIHDLIMEPRFAQLRAQGDTAAWRTIAATLNYRPVTEAPNPVTEPETVFKPGEHTLLDLSALITAQEYIVLADPDLKINSVATMIGTPEAAEAVRALSMWMQAAGHRLSVVYQVAERIMAEQDVPRLQVLMTLLVQSGLLSPESVATLQIAFLEPDPTWSATIYEYGQSEAQAVGYDWLTPDNVKIYVQEVVNGTAVLTNA